MRWFANLIYHKPVFYSQHQMLKVRNWKIRAHLEFDGCCHGGHIFHCVASRVPLTTTLAWFRKKKNSKFPTWPQFILAQRRIQCSWIMFADDFLHAWWGFELYLWVVLWTLFTDIGFWKCSWAHAGISMTESCLFIKQSCLLNLCPSLLLRDSASLWCFFYAFFIPIWAISFGIDKVFLIQICFFLVPLTYPALLRGFFPTFF